MAAKKKVTKKPAKKAAPKPRPKKEAAKKNYCIVDPDGEPYSIACPACKKPLPKLEPYAIAQLASGYEMFIKCTCGVRVTVPSRTVYTWKE